MRTGIGRDAARAIDALRRGWAIRLTAPDGAIRLMAIEGADAVTLADFDPHGRADILISAARAETLKLGNQLAAADPDMPVLVERADAPGIIRALRGLVPMRGLSVPHPVGPRLALVGEAAYHLENFTLLRLDFRDANRAFGVEIFLQHLCGALRHVPENLFAKFLRGALQREDQ